MITIDIEPILRAELEWQQAVGRFSDRVRHAVDRAVQEGRAEAINTRQYNDETGLLTSRIVGFIETSSPGGATGIIAALTPYASFVEGGTSPHVIRARNAPMLVFKARDGRWVRTKMVNHPGNAPMPFMGQAFLKAERVLVRELEVGVADLQRYIDG